MPYSPLGGWALVRKTERGSFVMLKVILSSVWLLRSTALVPAHNMKSWKNNCRDKFNHIV